MAIILLIKTEDNVVSELQILSQTTIGRSQNSDCQIADTKMSGLHCSFEINSSGQLLFKDLGSSNGSFANNSLTTQTLMRVNDILRIGSTLVKIDEQKLSTAERLSIGSSLVKKKQDKALPELSNHKLTPSADNASETPKKKTILLNNIHKQKRKMTSNWSASENVIDQEESTGRTKFLKLDRTTKNK
jgi:pSer/pThr/pTyr-binding forkhead associated (FHA) protein